MNRLMDLIPANGAKCYLLGIAAVLFGLSGAVIKVISPDSEYGLGMEEGIKIIGFGLGLMGVRHAIAKSGNETPPPK